MNKVRFAGFVMAVFFIFAMPGAVQAEDKVSVKGNIRDYDLEAKTVTITVEEGKDVTFSVENEKAMKKLDDRLFKGDEVRVRYIIKDNRNIIRDNNDLRGTKAGC